MAEAPNLNGIPSAYVHWKWAAGEILENIREEWLQAEKVDQVYFESRRLLPQNMTKVDSIVNSGNSIANNYIHLNRLSIIIFLFTYIF